MTDQGRVVPTAGGPPPPRLTRDITGARARPWKAASRGNRTSAHRREAGQEHCEPQGARRARPRCLAGRGRRQGPQRRVDPRRSRTRGRGSLGALLGDPRPGRLVPRGRACAAGRAPRRRLPPAWSPRRTGRRPTMRHAALAAAEACLGQATACAGGAHPRGGTGALSDERGGRGLGASARCGLGWARRRRARGSVRDDRSEAPVPHEVGVGWRTVLGAVLCDSGLGRLRPGRARAGPGAPCRQVASCGTPSMCSRLHARHEPSPAAGISP